MSLQTVIWLLCVLIAFWIFSAPITRVLRILWETFVPIFDKKSIDLRATFGEWAVITGSTDGVGKAYAKELALRNMNLILISRNLTKLENTKQEILMINPDIEVKIIVADFSKGKDVFDKIKSQLEDIPVGILVNNVGKMYEYPTYLGEVAEQDLWDIININVGATTLMTRLVITQMQKRKRGAIVNVSSGSDLQPVPLMTVYAATKMYIKSFSSALRIEYSRFGIVIQHLSPLFIKTKMNTFSHRLQVTSFLVPDATTYARNAVATLGKLNSSTGYWGHSIQTFFLMMSPEWMRMKIVLFLNENFRQDYFKQKKQKSQ